ncbi:MAG: hypothetical protein PF447_14585 [Spirochaetaceae bacterium]|jgi:hypothetical protein|nr:hypothetical protein [Spirochaetaceae bacterium]
MDLGAETNNMNLSIGGYTPPTAPEMTQEVQQLNLKSQNQSKDVIKSNVEAMLSLGKMEYIGMLVDMYV